MKGGLEVLSVSENEIVIATGPYEITFVKDEKTGKAKVANFTYFANRMEDSFIPSPFLNPAAQRANAIFYDRFHDQKKKTENQLEFPF